MNMEAQPEADEEHREEERPSVLADLKAKAEQILPMKRSECREEVL